MYYYDRILEGGSMNIVIENTTYCGANCIMCVRDKLNFKLGNMSFELFKKIILEFNEFCINKYGKGLDSIDYAGMGDPLLDIGLEDKLLYVKENFPNVKQKNDLLKKRSKNPFSEESFAVL